MKKILNVLITAVIIITACQPKTKTVPVDLDAAKASVADMLDKYNSAVKASDANAVMTLLTDDGLYCGTDPGEIMNKTDLEDIMKQAFADTSLVMNITTDKREIKVTADGNSAIALEQMIITPFSQKMPVRMIYHLVKNNDNWLFDFVSYNFIPNNEDLDKLNKALE